MPPLRNEGKHTALQMAKAVKAVQVPVKGILTPGRDKGALGPTDPGEFCEGQRAATGVWHALQPQSTVKQEAGGPPGERGTPAQEACQSGLTTATTTAPRVAEC